MSHPLPIPHFQQSTDGYCLPACVRMVLAYLQIERSEAEISHLLGTQTFGTPEHRCRRAPRELREGGDCCR
ncbi:MAG: hypothetical protein D6759_20150 [Chloroflexi bacterium]|nr:MAG: hypothetical protein D6759_20150 [Chloroflexota bacterium]